MKDIERGLVKTSVGYLHYRATGSGRPLVLMHVNGGSSTSYLELLEALPDNIRAVAVDYPGCGMSDHFEFEPTIHDYATVMAEFVKSLGLGKVTFLGQAGAGYVATELAVAFPEVTERIIMMSCPWYPDKAAQEAAHSGLAAVASSMEGAVPLPVSMEERLRRDPEHCPMIPSQLWADRKNVDAVLAGKDRSQLLRAFAAYDLAGNLPKVDVPAMNLWGEHFRYTRFQDEFAALVKDHRTTIIEGARIDPQFDHPHEVAEAIVAFLG